MTNFLRQYGDAATTAVGFFWKAGWAFVLGYFVSGMIQTFVPKARLTRYMGEADVRSVTLASAFGAASSSCSFAALAAARSLVLKGAHFVAAVAFMFASTNLVIELGILIVIFLGWSYLAAEVIGGLLLIAISSVSRRGSGLGWDHGEAVHYLRVHRTCHRRVDRPPSIGLSDGRTAGTGSAAHHHATLEPGAEGD